MCRFGQCVGTFRHGPIPSELLLARPLRVEGPEGQAESTVQRLRGWVIRWLRRRKKDSEAFAIDFAHFGANTGSRYLR